VVGTAKNFKGKCKLYVVSYLCIEDDCEGTQIHCKDDDGNMFHLRGTTPSDIDYMVDEGTLESGISEFDPNQEEKVTFNGESLQMDVSTNFTLGDLEIRKSEIYVLSPTTGDNKMLLVIIDALDHKVDYSSEQLSSDVFGSTDPDLKDEVNVNSVFRACSNNELRIFPGVEDNMDATGTVRVSINMNLEGSDASTIMNAGRAAAATKLGINLPGSYQNIYYVKKQCYPISCSYAAYAYIGGIDSVYQGKYIRLSGVQAHEHGHNLGLSHSGEGTKAYEDHSCMMGNPLYSDETGKMCFNPAKSWMLNWYPGSYAEINPSSQPAYYERLVGAGEWKPGSDRMVSVKIEKEGREDFYVGFNRAAGANVDNKEFSNEVTVIEAQVTTNRSNQSWIKAHLKNGEESTLQSNIRIKVCNIVTKIEPGYADIVIYDPNKSDGRCDKTTSAPTARGPTSAPTERGPTGSPTSSKPTESPTSSKPTESPTSSKPTESPTLLPTVLCEDDLDFVKGRGMRKRTCAYIGEGNRKWRINKWCEKKKRGVPISISCCKTCRKVVKEFSILLPASTTTELVHGICLKEAVTASASSTSSLRYTAVDPFASGTKAWDDRDYKMQGVENTPCAGGTFLRPSLHKSIMKGTVITLNYSGYDNVNVCVFVDLSRDGGWHSTLIEMGFTDYGQSFKGFKWDLEQWDVFCIGKVN